MMDGTARRAGREDCSRPKPQAKQSKERERERARASELLVRSARLFVSAALATGLRYAFSSTGSYSLTGDERTDVSSEPVLRVLVAKVRFVRLSGPARGSVCLYGCHHRVLRMLGEVALNWLSLSVLT